ncbi:MULTISPECIES: hypothetical protein [Enterococcus]|nr:MULTISPECIES: hypothetical protein [Enterococcus]MCD5162232.1 hypothetical protein [Enterococcus casseliflavus]MCM6927586.1 hypothetical protein [Enterococcus faecium]MCM6935477.1 hypothetical protein [Enterococcus faecium]
MTKKRYIVSKIVNIFLFNSFIIGLIFLMIKIISLLFLDSDVTVDPSQNISMFGSNLLTLFNNHAESTIAIVIYTIVGFSFLISLIVLFGEVFGKIASHILYIFVYALIVWSSRPSFADLISNDTYDLLKMYSYIILPVDTLAEYDLSLVGYLLVKWSILFLLLCSMLFMYTANNFAFSYSFLDKLFISKQIILASILFLGGYMGLFYLYSSDISKLFSLYSYGYFYPPNLIWLMVYFLFIPFVLSIRFSQLEEGISFLVVRCHSLKHWRKTCLTTVLKCVCLYLAVVFIVVFSLLNLSNDFSNEIVLKNIGLNFLEVICITLTYLLVYFNSKSTIISFIFCFSGYLVITFPLDFVKWLPFALSSSTRVTEIGFSTVIIIFLVIILIEGCLIFYSGKVKTKLGRADRIV